MKETPIRSVWVVLATLALSNTLVDPARSQDKNDTTEAKRLFKEGNALFIEKDYQAAIERFSASIELYPTYNGFYNLANSYRALRRYADALDVVKAMNETLGPPSKPSVKEQFQSFETDIYSIVGVLRVRVKPDGATVSVDGLEVGRTPIKEGLILGPGIHEVTARKIGFDKATVHAEVHSEQHSSVEIELSPEVAALYLTVDVQGALVTLDNEPMGKTPLEAPLSMPPGAHRLVVSKPGYITEDQELNIVPGDKTALTVTLEKRPDIDDTQAEIVREGRHGPLFWISLSATGAAAVLGGIFWGLASAKANDVQKNDSDYLAARTEDMINFYDDERRDARKTGRRFQNAAIGLTVATGVFAAATVGVIIFETHRRPSENPQSLSARPGGLTVRF